MIFEQYVQILFKTWYRHLILKHVLSQFESSDPIHNLTNSIGVLDAIYFIKKAWDDVSSDTIKNFFKKTGFREVNDEFESDQFDPEDEIPLSKLVQMSTLMREIDNSDLYEFIDIDAHLDTEDGNPDNVLLDNFQNQIMFCSIIFKIAMMKNMKLLKLTPIWIQKTVIQIMFCSIIFKIAMMKNMKLLKLMIMRKG
ncbi:DDE superfamily endonuclease [Popillia japonica]|uniref:DDE superfamily endonuclease n=1 Tax=Popillia japonica TaxID=7064 RepID=A0AAW1JIH7_POPJA